MRELTKDQELFLAMITSPERRAEAARNQAAHEAAMASAKAEADRLYAFQRELYEARLCEQERKLRPLREALASAGITLQLSSYEGIWGSYQIGNGPKVEVDIDSLDTFEED